LVMPFAADLVGVGAALDADALFAGAVVEVEAVEISTEATVEDRARPVRHVLSPDAATVSTAELPP
jgi:hypothetical protein